MRQSYNGKVYDTEKATQVACKVSDGFERGSRFLYSTNKGEFFRHIVPPLSTSGNGGRIEPLTEEEALKEYNDLPEREMDFADSFPSIEFEEA